MMIYMKTWGGRVAGCGRFHNILQLALHKKIGNALTNNPEEATIILFSAGYISGTNMLRWISEGKKFVHRVDGSFGREGRPHLEAAMLTVNQQSNITVFQSRRAELESSMTSTLACRQPPIGPVRVHR